MNSSIRPQPSGSLPQGGSRALAATAPRSAIYTISIMSVVAGAIHLWATPDHLALYWLYGVFFIGAGVGQCLYPLLLVRRPSQLVASIGLWANLAIVLIYDASRTVGLPIGPHGQGVEFVGPLDITATACELGIVLVSIGLLHGRTRVVTVNLLLAIGVLLWVLRLTGVTAPTLLP